MLTKAGVYASLALAASAVLIPPHMTAEDLGDDLALEIAVQPFKRTVALECAECASASAEGNRLGWEQNVGATYVCLLIATTMGALTNSHDSAS